MTDEELKMNFDHVYNQAVEDTRIKFFDIIADIVTLSTVRTINVEINKLLKGD